MAGTREGKYFVVRSVMNGLVLDIENNSSYPGARVGMWHAKGHGENDNQVFYEDQASGTLRSKLNDFCIDVAGDTIVMNPYQHGDTNQQWMVAGNRIQNRTNNNWVFDISGRNSDAGAAVCPWDYHGGDNQQWCCEYSEPLFVVIKSQMCDKVLDVDDGSRKPGTNVIIYDYKKKNEANQLWYEDRTGIIRSALNDFALDSTRSHIKLQPYDPNNPNHQWIIVGDRIQNVFSPDKVLDIEGNSSWNGTKLCTYKWHGKPNQKWIFRPVL